MAREHPDLVGQRFKKLKVVEFSHVDGSAYWKCQCDCGKLKLYRTSDLNSGRIGSCGCGRGRKRVHGRALNNRYDPTYRSWYDMIRRCYDPHCVSFQDYGANGVEVTRRWRGKGGFDRFLEDMGEKPPRLTLDRINPFGNYQKSNCRWATRKTQQTNLRVHWTGTRRIV